MNNKVIFYSATLATMCGTLFATSNSIKADEKEQKPKEVTLEKGVKRTSTIQKNTRATGDVKEKDKVQPGDSIDFKMDYTVPNNIDMDSFVLEDKIEDVLKACDTKDVHVYLIDDKGGDGAEITSKGKVTVENNTIKFTVTDNPKQFAGKKLRIKASASLKYEQNFDKYKENGKIKIPNVGDMLIHDKLNNQDVKVPTDKVIMTPEIIENKQEKFIIVDGKEGKQDDDVKMGETVPFELKFTVSNDKDYKDLSITDDVDDRLDVKKDSIHIFDKDKKDVTDKFVISVDESKELITIKPKTPRDWRGKDIVVKFDTTLKYDTKVEDDTIIKNKSNLNLDNKAYPTNEVELKTNVVKPTAEKWIVTEAGNKKADDTSKKA